MIAPAATSLFAYHKANLALCIRLLIDKDKPLKSKSDQAEIEYVNTDEASPVI